MTHDYAGCIQFIESFHPDMKAMPINVTILHALKLAQKVTGEPSEGMMLAQITSCKSGLKGGRPRVWQESYKALIQQAEREIDNV